MLDERDRTSKVNQTGLELRSGDDRLDWSARIEPFRQVRRVMEYSDAWLPPSLPVGRMLKAALDEVIQQYSVRTIKNSQMLHYEWPSGLMFCNAELLQM